MLVGEWSENDNLDDNAQEIKKGLSESQVIDVDEMSIKSEIEGAKHLFKAEECTAKFISNHGCYIVEGENED